MGCRFVLQIEISGDDLLNVSIADRSRRAALAQFVRESGSWRECVEGMDSLVVQFDSAEMSVAAAREKLWQQLQAAPRRMPRSASEIIEIPVCYGDRYGPEFESICEMTGLNADQLIRIHTGREHRVDLIGFTPGFAYLSGLDDDLRIPRLTEPRQRVEAGSVGIAGGFTGMYAVAGPGGWPLIGRTPLALFRPSQAQPFVLRIGARVRFVSIDEAAFSAFGKS